MKKQGYIIQLVTRLLVLYFTFVVIPIDFFHHHQDASFISSGSLVHLSKRISNKSASLSSYCFICNAHFDRHAETDIWGNPLGFYERDYRILPVEEISIPRAGLIHHIDLRGPPRPRKN